MTFDCLRTRRNRVAIVLAAVAAIGEYSMLSLWAQLPVAKDQAAATSGESVVATVDGQPISAKEVNRLLTEALHGQPLAAEARSMAEAQALEQVIGRRLVSRFLDEKKITVPAADVEARIQTLAAEAIARGKTLDAVLAERGMTRDEFRADLAWELRWGRYTQGELTDAKLEAWFKEHHADFDGTEVRVSHILLRPVGDSNPAAIDALVKRALLLRDEILAGRTTFAEAAQRYSAGPSRVHDGDLGYIPRHGRMVESFNTAAFKLKKDEISPPVVTPFGVHLIRCTEIRPGAKPWQDVRDELAKPIVEQWFAEIVARLRPQAKIEYSPRFPHLDPATGQLKSPQ